MRRRDNDGLRGASYEISVENGTLTLTDRVTPATGRFFRVPDTLVGTCLDSGEPCQLNAECRSGICIDHMCGWATPVPVTHQGTRTGASWHSSVGLGKANL